MGEYIARERVPATQLAIPLLARKYRDVDGATEERFSFAEISCEIQILDITDDEQVDIALRACGAPCCRAVDAGKFDIVAKAKEGIAQDVRRTERLAHQRFYFREYRRFARGAEIALTTFDLRFDQSAGDKRFQFSLDGALSRLCISDDLVEIEARMRTAEQQP